MLRSLLIAFALAVLAHPALGQSPLPTAAVTGSKSNTQKPALPEKLSRQSVRDVISGLSDAQARELLLQELDKRVAAAEAKRAAEDSRSFQTIISETATGLIQSVSNTVLSAPLIPGAVAKAYAGYAARRGDAPGWWIIVSLTAAIAAGIAATWAMARLTQKSEARLATSQPRGMWSRLGLVILRFLFHSTRLVAFVTAGFAVSALLNDGVPGDRMMVDFLIEAGGWTWLAVMSARFILSPTRPELRLCPVDDETARFLTWRIGLIFGWSAFSIGLLPKLIAFGWPYGEVRLGFFLSLLLHVLIGSTIWQARHGIMKMLKGHGDEGSTWHAFSDVWPKIAIGFVVLQWLVIELFVSTGNLASLSMTAINTTTAIVLALPLFELMIRALVEGTWPVDKFEEPALQAAHRETQAGLVRCARIISIVGAGVFLTWLWGFNIFDHSGLGAGGRIAGVLFDIGIVLAVAYGLWELLNILSDRQIAIERVTLGIDPDSEMMFDGEGGQGGTRLGTLMPLIRGTGRVFIFIMVLLEFLAQMGVNILPLLAGAGIVGLAIGFGAQTLIKDIISGLFFLIDDAFRRGEYVDIGDVKGTVEKISIRSMQLRHHNGPLNTIPFGEIKFLTNFSRDWVMMKLPLRVTYDTDVEKLRKSIKKLGQELAEDPNFGHLFLQPLKSQGVIQMDDSAMIVRVKFMCRPGDQWGLRRHVFTRIRELFELEGHKFAHREVTVRIADEDGANGEQDQARRRQAATAAARSVIEQQDAEVAEAGMDSTR